MYKGRFICLYCMQKICDKKLGPRTPSTVFNVGNVTGSNNVISRNTTFTLVEE